MAFNNDCPDLGRSVAFGLDFGSTASASASFAKDSRDPSDLGVVPKFSTKLLVRVPDADNPNRFTLEFRSPSNPELDGRWIRYLKLYLMVTLQDEDAKGLRSMANSQAVNLDLPDSTDMAATFFKGLWAEAKANAAKTNPPSHQAPPHVAVTYPGNWDDNEISSLKEAVRKAGIEDEVCQRCKVSFIPEQTAAAYAILQSETELMHSIQRGGQSIMVVDLGGATSDAAVLNLGSNKDTSTTLGTVVDNQSTFVGGISMDLEFGRLMAAKILRKAPNASEEFMSEHSSVLLRRWQVVKETFLGWNVDSCIYYPFDVDGRMESVSLSRSETLGIFRKLIDRLVKFVLQLFKRQHDKNVPQTIFFTGGLSRSTYLRLRLPNELKEDADLKSVEIIFTTRPFLKVCQGAALSFFNHIASEG